jgi:peptide/nickel transport system substrate-binding protein
MHPLRRREFLRLCARAGLYAGLGMGAGLSGCLEEKKPAVPSSPTAGMLHQVKGSYISGTSAGDAETLNWALAVDNASFGYVGLAMDGLVTYNNNLEMELRWLAEPIEVAEDGLTYTLILRDDLYWSDGNPLTSGDFVYTFKNILFSDWAPFNYKDSYIETVAGEPRFVDVVAKDKHSFEFIRETVEPEFLFQATDFWVYPKHIVQKYEGEVDAFTQAEELNSLSYTGNLGPYQVVDWIRNDKFVLERNPDYYLGEVTGAPFFDEYVVKIFGTPAARHAALEAGDITAAGIDPLQVKKFKELESIIVHTTPTSGYSALFWNLRNNGWEGFKNRTVREAFALAIGKEQIIQSIYLGFADPAFSFIPRPSPWFVEEGLKRYGVGDLYNKQDAIIRLEAEGYRQEDGVLLDLNGEPLKLNIITNSGNKVRESIAFLVKQELSDLGVEIKLYLIPWPTMLNQYLRNKVPGSDLPAGFNNGAEAKGEKPWDLLIMGFGTDVKAPSGSSVFFTSEGGLNLMGYSNPEVDELFNRANSKEALESVSRRDIYGRLAALLSEDLPIDFLTYPQANTGFQSNVKGIEPGISMGYNNHLWYFEG